MSTPLTQRPLQRQRRLPGRRSRLPPPRGAGRAGAGRRCERGIALASCRARCWEPSAAVEGVAVEVGRCHAATSCALSRAAAALLCCHFMRCVAALLTAGPRSLLGAACTSVQHAKLAGSLKKVEVSPMSLLWEQARVLLNSGSKKTGTCSVQPQYDEPLRSFQFHPFSQRFLMLRPLLGLR